MDFPPECDQHDPSHFTAVYISVWTETSAVTRFSPADRYLISVHRVWPHTWNHDYIYWCYICVYAQTFNTGTEPRISALNELEETICKLHWMYHHSTYKPVISCDFDVNTIKLSIGVCTLSPYSLYNCNLNMFRSIIQIVSRHTVYGHNCMYIEIKKHLQI